MMPVAMTLWRLMLPTVLLLCIGAAAVASRTFIPSPEQIAVTSEYVFVGRVVRSRVVERVEGLRGWKEVLYTVQPTQILRGKVPEIVVVRGRLPSAGNFPNTGVFLAERDPASFMHLREIGFYPVDEAKRMESLVKFADHPEVALESAAENRTHDFLQVTSWKVMTSGKLSGIPRERLIEHYRTCLEAPEESRLAITAILALDRVQDAGSAPQVARLLESEVAAKDAARFLAKYPHRDTVQAMCEHLNRLRVKEPDLGQDDIACALMSVESAEALPAIRRGIPLKICDRLSEALGFLGDASDFDRLLGRLNGDEKAYAATGLSHLVARSNMPLEPWMKTEYYPVNDEIRQKWAAWWGKNKAGVRIEKTATEAGLKKPVG